MNQEPNIECHCERTDSLHRRDSNFVNHTFDRCWRDVKEPVMANEVQHKETCPAYAPKEGGSRTMIITERDADTGLPLCRCSEVPSWEIEMEEMFVVGNMRFSGLANGKLTPENLRSFIHEVEAAAEARGKKEACEEITAKIQNLYDNDPNEAHHSPDYYQALKDAISSYQDSI